MFLTPRVPLVANEPVAITVVIVDGGASSREGASPNEELPAASDVRVAASSNGSGQHSETGSADEPTTKPTARSRYMTMRFPEKPKLKWTPSPEFWERFERNTKPLAPPPNIPGERVANEIAELRAKLHRADRFSAEEIEVMRSELVALNEEREAEELKPTGGGRYKTEKDTFRAHVAADGSVKLEDKLEAMDATDRAMLAMGIDPYLRKKLDYLDRTRDQRVAIGKRYREEQLEHSTQFAHANVERLWSSTTDLAARKQGLFELWDECFEDGDKAELAGGAAARAYIMAFIRAKLTGADAYTAEELARLNAKRQSKELFAP